MPNRFKMTIPEIFLRARVREIDRSLAIPTVPAVAGNARVIAAWPAKQASTIALRSYATKGVSYRVW
jgi:hypothetical protein